MTSRRDATAELRMLRAKAYGPGDGLSAEELDRLLELEGRGLQPAVAPETAKEPEITDGDELTEASTEPTDDFLQEFADDRVVESAVGATPVDEPEPAPVAGAPARRSRRWRAFVAAAAVLGIGLGVGWGIWGWDREAAALAAAHSDTQADLEASGRYDSGTITPVLEQYGVVIWDAQRADGTERCVIITSPEPASPQSGCMTSEQMADSAWPNAAATVPDGEEKAGQQLSAALLPLPSGELVPFVQVWDMDNSGWESQFDENELAQLAALEDAGHGRSTLNILGNDGDRIIWSTWETGTLCVIAGVGERIVEACAEDSESTISIGLDVDGIRTHYIVTQSERRSPQLTIYKDADPEYYFGSDEASSIDEGTGE